MWLPDTCKKNKPLLYFDRYVDSSHCRGDVAHDIGPGVAAVRRDRRPLHGRLSTPQTVSFSIPTILLLVLFFSFLFFFFTTYALHTLYTCIMYNACNMLCFFFFFLRFYFAFFVFQSHTLFCRLARGTIILWRVVVVEQVHSAHTRRTRAVCRAV